MVSIIPLTLKTIVSIIVLSTSITIAAYLFAYYEGNIIWPKIHPSAAFDYGSGHLISSSGYPILIAPFSLYILGGGRSTA